MQHHAVPLAHVGHGQSVPGDLTPIEYVTSWRGPYMSPEQIAAGRMKLDHRTDVYSLGAVLYEMLTLQRPFPGDSREEVIGAIMTKDPRPPRRSVEDEPPDLIDVHRLFYLAMVSSKLEKQAEALSYYERGVARMEKRRTTRDPFHIACREEAASQLGIED